MFLRATIATLMSLCLAAPASADRIAVVPEPPPQAHGTARFCGAPRPQPGQRVVLVGAYEGDGMSTVAVGGQDVETTVAYVDIEPGTEPLYVVLTSYSSMI